MYFIFYYSIFVLIFIWFINNFHYYGKNAMPYLVCSVVRASVLALKGHRFDTQTKAYTLIGGLTPTTVGAHVGGNQSVSLSLSLSPCFSLSLSYLPLPLPPSLPLSPKGNRKKNPWVRINRKLKVLCWIYL